MSLSSLRLLCPALLACCLCLEIAAANAEAAAATLTGATTGAMTGATTGATTGVTDVASGDIGRAGSEAASVARPGQARLVCDWTPVADPRHPEYPPRLVLEPVLELPLGSAVPGVAPPATRGGPPAGRRGLEEGVAGACAAIGPLHPAVVHPAGVHPVGLHPVVVHAASAIAMVEQSEHARVTLSVVALEEGAIGSVIRCRSSLAGAILLGRVVDSSTVERVAPEGRVQW